MTTVYSTMSFDKLSYLADMFNDCQDLRLLNGTMRILRWHESYPAIYILNLEST